ncbi:MAG: SufBD protein [Thermoplasmata archaeon]|nr:MAG: SufBD protein [Thermoplasmata archaeon]
MEMSELLKELNMDEALRDPDTAHLVIERNRVVSSHWVQGLEVKTEEIENGVEVSVRVREGTVITKPVHFCFGVTHKRALQRIVMHVHVERGAKIAVLSHCMFPKAEDITHVMEADITLDEGASYVYREKHIHSPDGGIEVYPRATITLGKRARFATEFELIQGRVGKIDIDYAVTCGEESTMEMMTKISGRGDDDIKIRETGYLVGERARGVLTSRVAVREHATAEVYSKLVATAPYARGHVDCHEIVQDQGVATAVPVVEVKHPKAHVTHEAAIGSVDTKQLETLMARGLSEEEAVEFIIQGLLS